MRALLPGRRPPPHAGVAPPWERLHTNYCRSHVRARSPARPRRPDRRGRRQHPDLVRARDVDRARGVRRRRPRLGGRAHAARARRRTVSGRAPRAALVPGARYGAARRRPGRVRPRVQPGAHPARPVRARTRAARPTASWRGVALARSPTTGSTGRGVVEAARRRSTTRWSTRRTCAGFSKLNRAIPEPLRGTYAGLAHDALDRVPHRPRRHDRRAAPRARVRHRAAPGAAGPPQLLGLQHPRLLRGARAVRDRRPRRPRGRTPCGASSRAWSGGCTRPASRWCSTSSTTTPPRRAVGARPTRSAASTTRPTTATTRTAAYVDTTGCGNTLDFGRAAPQRLVLDSMRYFADELQVDGFRLDLAATLGRDDHGGYTPEHPLLRAHARGPGARSDAKLIAEPWDVGPGGWQTGNFPAGFTEWNDRYRDRMRDFWLGDLRRERADGHGRQRHRPVRHPARRLGEHLLARARAAREPQLRDRARRLHPRRPHGLRREAQPRQRRAQPRRHRPQQLLQPRCRGRDRRSRRSARHAGAASGTCSAPCCSRPACRCSPPATSTGAASAATTTPTATTPS